MNVIEKYFRKKTDKVSFIELKNNLEIYKKYGLDDIPLPIISEDMMEGIKSTKFNNEISIDYIVDGILYMIAIDSDFIYTLDYKNILNKILDNPSKYAMSKAVKEIQNNNEKALIFSRSAFILDEKNELAAYNYAKLLWNLDVLKEEKHVFVEESVRILDRIIKFNDKNSLANYELGNINVATGNYIRANSFYKSALKNSEIEELSEEIRLSMLKIQPDVSVENSIYFINTMKYENAIMELMDARKNSSRYDIPYYLAIAYMNIEKPELAEKFFEESIEKGADFSTLYTDLVYVKYLLNKSFEAVEIANNAIEKFPTDIKLRYNRAIIYIEQKRYDKANEDFDFILEYADLSDEMFNQIMKIKESIGGF